jgi:hypothetical protein
MPALRIILGAVFPEYFGSSFNSEASPSRESNKKSVSRQSGMTLKAGSSTSSDPEADPLNKSIASWGAVPTGTDDRSRTPSPVEMHSVKTDHA